MKYRILNCANATHREKHEKLHIKRVHHEVFEPSILIYESSQYIITTKEKDKRMLTEYKKTIYEHVLFLFGVELPKHSIIMFSL